MCRNVGIEQDHFLKRTITLFCDCAVCVKNVNLMFLIRSQKISSAHALFPFKIVFRKHVIVGNFGSIIRFLHMIFFQMESLCGN